MHINHRRKNKQRSYHGWVRGSYRGWETASVYKKAERRSERHANKQSLAVCLDHDEWLDVGKPWLTVKELTWWY